MMRRLGDICKKMKQYFVFKKMTLLQIAVLTHPKQQPL